MLQFSMNRFGQLGRIHLGSVHLEQCHPSEIDRDFCIQFCKETQEKWANLIHFQLMVELDKDNEQRSCWMVLMVNRTIWDQ